MLCALVVNRTGGYKDGTAAGLADFLSYQMPDHGLSIEQAIKQWH